MSNAHKTGTASGRMKSAVNVSLPRALVESAREHRINMSAVLESALADVIAQHERRKWRQENAAAIEAYNRAVQEHGTFGDKVRQF